MQIKITKPDQVELGDMQGLSSEPWGGQRQILFPYKLQSLQQFHLVSPGFIKAVKSRETKRKMQYPGTVHPQITEQSRSKYCD